MKFEKQPQPTQGEIKDVEKEMSKSDRTIRINEALEECRIEQETSWVEKERSKTERPKNQEVEQQIKSSLDTVSDSGIVKVYDKSGKFVFSGSPDQLMIFWKNKDYGVVENIGGISDEDGKSIFRFGAGDDHGFTDRKRMEGLFQQLEGQVARKKSIAQDQRRIAEIRQSLGQGTLPPETQEKSLEQVMEQPENKIENPIEQESLFDDEKAKQILEVTKNWVKFGGNFYDHLTGKNLNLERGVDYKVNQDGTPDMVSFREARQKKIDAWLQDPSNQEWVAAGPKFGQDHKQELGYDQEIVKAKQPDGTFVDKERYTKPYFYENGWLYYESNYFDKQTGEFKQPERESTKYRVYFNCEGEDILPTYQGVIEQLNQDPELQKLGFQIKTADVSEVSPREIGQIMNQKDRIVLYLGEKGIGRALPILQKYAEQNRQKFSRGGVLFAQPLIDNQGQEISGVRVTSETKGISPESNKEYASFSDMQSEVVESCFRSIIVGLKNPKTLESIATKYPVMKDVLSKLPVGASVEDYIKGILSDPNGEEFLIKNLKVIYPQWSKAFGMSEKNIAFKAN
ncbi:MAG: hypothetical protein NTW73_00410 [Candidatus Parcubacteria bacterium]|nr:hypothetical protein [Candidatus Parcubacteria bacterium]